jgi:hypothetical protein
MAQYNEFPQWEQIGCRLQQADGLPFSELLAPERVARVLAALGVKFRERIYTPAVTLWTFLSQVLSPDHLCLEAVGRLLAWRLSQGKAPCSTDTSSYCDARQRLPVELVKSLVRETGCELQPQAEAAWLWKGRHVKIADGTTVTMPDTAANQAAYPRRRNQRRGVGFPIARVVAILSLASGAVLDAAMGPMRGKKTGENTLFRGLYPALNPGDVLLGDRLFCSYQDLATCGARGIDIVVRQHQSRHTDFRRGQWLGMLDHLAVWQRPKFNCQRFDRATWEALPEWMVVRELRFDVTQSGFRPKEITLVTSLLDPVEFSATEIGELYRERWHCELDLRSLKTTLQMTHLRCKSPQMVEKDLWAHFLAYNLIRQTMNEAARNHCVLPRQLSFKGAVQMVNSFATYLVFYRSQRDRFWGQLLTAIATHVVGDRPNRFEPRKLKYRLGKYTYMTRPRNEERQRLCA